MAAAAAAAAADASVPQIRHKRQREDAFNSQDTYSGDYPDDQNRQKRSHHGLQLELFSPDDGDGLDGTVQDELVLLVMKNLEKEISGTSELLSTTGGYNNQIHEKNSTSVDKECAGDDGVSVSPYEYLVSATDDELGIPSSPLVSVVENDSHSFSTKFWNDLFQNSLTEPDSTDQAKDLLQPFLSHCYSYNYRDYGEYNHLFINDTDRQEWIEESVTDWAYS